jgi:hypothetical protein
MSPPDLARLYADENFPLPVVEELRRLGHDVLTAVDAGQAGRAIPDDQVLKFAISEDRAILTLNRRHFVRLHAQINQHSGVIVCTLDPDFRAQAIRVHDEIGRVGKLSGMLLRINRPQIPA